MDIILIIGVFEACFLIAMILAKKSKIISDWLMAFNLLVFGLTIFLSFLEIYNRQHNYSLPFLITLSPPFIFLHGPAIWMYVKSLTNQNFSIKWNHLLHLAPFVIMFALFSKNMYLLPHEQKIAMDATASFKNEIFYPFSIAFVAISSQSYLWLSFVNLRKYNIQIKNYYAEVEKIELKWLRLFVVSAIICYATNSMLYIFDYIFNIFAYNTLQLIGFIVASIYILFLGFFGLKQGNIFVNNGLKENLANLQPKNTSIQLLRSEDIFIKNLSNFMEEQKPFQNPELTVAKLSDSMGVTPEYLSNILNNHLKKNFFDFVNFYRIEEFKIRCASAENSKLTLLGIAFDCGFNSKATFNRVFKNYTGTTPSAYLKEVSKK